MKEKLYKVPLPIAGIFILAGLFILTFSFIVDDKCPKDLDPLKCNDYSKNKRIQKLTPIFMSYGFLFLALTFWYLLFYWWDNKKQKEEASIIRITAENDDRIQTYNN
jgi:hypothetical protein